VNENPSYSFCSTTTKKDFYIYILITFISFLYLVVEEQKEERKYKSLTSGCHVGTRKK